MRAEELGWVLLALLFIFFRGVCCEDSDPEGDPDGDPDDLLSSLKCNSSTGVLATQEGDALEICLTKSHEYLDKHEVLISLTPTNHKSTRDFVAYEVLLDARTFCTTIQTVDDDIIEDVEEFMVTMSIPTLPGISRANCPAIIIDNDGPSEECGIIAVYGDSANLTSRNDGSCTPSVNYSRCLNDRSKWQFSCSCINSSDIPALLDPNDSTEISTYFPNINTNDQGRASCIAHLHQYLIKTLGNSVLENGTDTNGSARYANCYISVVNECSASILYLQRVWFPGILDLESNVFQMNLICVSVEIKCCTMDLPPACLPSTANSTTDSYATTVSGGIAFEPFQPSFLSTQGTAGLIAGAVGGILLMIIATVLCIVLLICCLKRRKLQKMSTVKEKTTINGNTQSVKYMPKRQASSAMSSISQESSSGLDNSVDTTITHLPSTGYEQVAVTDSEPYSQWKMKFSKVLIDGDRLKFESIIGEGEFSLVCRANYTSAVMDTPIQVAIKKLKDVSDNYQIEKFISESEIMLHLDHPNILNLMGMCFNMEDNLPAIVLPYMENGDLRKFLITKRGQMKDSEEKYPKGLSQEVLLQMCMDIARGMHYLTKCKLVHRDLAARNCMVDNDIRVKIADFGLSRDIQHTNFYKLTHRQRLPVKWMAPESLFKNIFSQRSDVWSYGIVCWEIFKLGKKPYSGIENQELPDYISHGYRPKKPSRCPAAMYEIMRDAWSEEPEDRPSFRTIVKSLANLMQYEGNIEEELNRETAQCKAHRVYNNVDLSSFGCDVAQPGKDVVYSQPNAPVYSTCSQEENIPGFPLEYEIPMPSSQTSEISAVPMDYEIPQPKHGRRSRNTSRPNSVEPRSHSRQASPLVVAGASSRPPSRHSVKSIRIPVTDSIPIQDPRRKSSHDSDKILPPYSKLNYKRNSSDSSNRVFQSVPTTEKPYSTLEWNSSQPTPTPNNHHYHTLEYSLSDQL